MAGCAVRRHGGRTGGTPGTERIGRVQNAPHRFTWGKKSGPLASKGKGVEGNVIRMKTKRGESQGEENTHPAEL